MGKTNFQNSWKKDWLWLFPVKNNVYEAMCTVCGGNLNVGNRCYWSYLEPMKEDNEIT